MAINKVHLSGKLAAKPELVNKPEATPMSVMRLAHSYKETTSWYTVIAYASIAEYLVKYAHKGQTIFVEGRLDSRKYTDKSGQTREGISVIVLSVELGRESLKPKESVDTSFELPIESDIMEQDLA